MLVAHALTGTMHKKHDDDTDTLILAKSLRAQGQIAHREDVDTYVVSPTLREHVRNNSNQTTEASMLVTHTLKAGGHDASEDGTGRDVPMVTMRTNGHAGSNGLGVYEHGDAPTLDSSAGVGIQSGMAVRRLTPTECERLQGFPDGWTCLCTPLEEWARDPEGSAERCECPDSPRYRMMGNAVTVTVIEWIGRRLIREMTR